MGFILKGEDKTCKKIIEQYNEYKKNKEKIKNETKQAIITESSFISAGTHTIPKSKKKVSDINERRCSSYTNKFKKDIKKTEIKEEDKMKNKEKNNFYDMFDGTKEQVNYIIENYLTDLQRNVVLKKWNNDLENGEKIRGGFTDKENQAYFNAINNIKNWLIEPPKKKGKKRENKDGVLPITSKVKQGQNFETEKKEAVVISPIESIKAGTDNITIKQNWLDENLEYLKLYELFNMPYFMEAMKKIDPRDYRILFLKMNYPKKSISEISVFTNIEEDKVKEIFKKVASELKLVLDSLINEVFGITDEKKEEISYRKDNM